MSTAHERPTGPMKVLYVSPHAALGGAERVTMDLIAGHDRAVVAPSVCFLAEGPLVEHCRTVLQVPTTVLPRPRLRSLGQRRRTVRALADLVRDQGIELVHSAMAWGHALGGRGAAGKKLVPHRAVHERVLVCQQSEQGDSLALRDFLSYRDSANRIHTLMLHMS